MGLVSVGLGTELTRFGQNMLIHDSALFVETKHTFKGLKTKEKLPEMYLR